MKPPFGSALTEYVRCLHQNGPTSLSVISRFYEYPPNWQPHIFSEGRDRRHLDAGVFQDNWNCDNNLCSRSYLAINFKFVLFLIENAQALNNIV